MKSEKESQQRQGREKLLDDGDDVDREQDCGGKLGLRCLLGCCCELVLIMSCCYCCFGCGGMYCTLLCLVNLSVLLELAIMNFEI